MRPHKGEMKGTRKRGDAALRGEGKIKLYYIGHDDEKGVDSKKTRMQIEAVTKLKCSLLKLRD